MSAAGARSTGASRRLAFVAGAAGWGVLMALGAGRMFLGVPRGGALAISIAGAAGLLLTSATLLIVSELRLGFGALDAFFTAALARSAQRRDEPAPPRPPQTPQRGLVGDRPFIANSDGTVTVETRLGPRLFPSLADAQDFVGP